MNSRLERICASCLTLVVGGCVAPGEAPVARVAITVAPLNLTGISDVDYTITVTNGGVGDVVWTRALSSSAYGDGAGSLSYVGTCDASADVNTVTLSLTALYDAGGEVPTSSYLNPGPISRGVTCVEGTDAAVAFDLTVARQAEQGFFDVAIQFDDIYCSAKLDCCKPSEGTSCAGDGSDDLRLLFDADGARGRTIVLGFACTAGTEVGVVTELALEDLVLDCDVGSTDATFVADVTIDPNGDEPGNQCDAGALGGCPAITEHGTASADAFLFQVAVFRGEEALTNAGGNAHLAYWNVALGVTGSISQCTLRTRATAFDSADPTGPVEGADYPYVFWDADLGSCAAEELDLSAPGEALTSSYATFLPLTPDPPLVSYAPATLTCTRGQACALDPPTSTGGTVASYAVAPALPAGLTLDEATGAIAGTPTALSAAASYTVTASNAGGDAAVSVTVTVIDVPPSALTYSPSSVSCTRTQPCSLAAPTHGGGAVASYGIAPALPAGLALNPATGAIAGTPTALSGATSYTVTATNTGGATSGSITVTVVELPPSGLTYSPSSLTCTRAQACSLAAPTHGGGAVVSYGIAPALPSGLAINTGTGAISGIPTLTSGATVYTVTATNASGATTAAVTVTVVDPPVAAVTFTNANAIGENGPTQAQLNAAYAGTPLEGQVTLTAGAQRWVVPATGTYRIQAAGAEGGPGYDASVSGGKGATIRGDFSLSVNTTLYVVVGQAGSTNGAGGGTFVWIANASQPLVAAGGGGGPGGHPSAFNFGNGKPGVTTTSGTSGNGSGAGGAGGGAGSPGNTYGSNGINGSGGGGAGWNGDATGGFAGAEYNAIHRGRAGTGGGGGASGWGGGGSAWLGGGGGGGYSGGGGGSWASGTGGGGGGSYNAGASQSNVGGNHSGQGLVTITKL
ncbi:MAG: hypothetical protein CVU56_18480 [Deltaproteobacteria bacterium HGW-Deltaproteobacteria-14]|jgi:uncharacterized repeat protein (TIGR01451 family)|nr:MAG: hypothetical protein CVU56_18480 [Deltaproteobacteria bacterium HGW-Deltaproteobacteria-14]